MQHRMVDVVVATAGGLEEDLIKCMGHMHIGDFALKGAQALYAASKPLISLSTNVQNLSCIRRHGFHSMDCA